MALLSSTTPPAGKGGDDLRRALRAAEPCVGCGACMSVCPVYGVGKREELVARGKLRLVAALGRGELPPGPELVEALSRCLLCGRCTANCPSQTPAREALQAARASLAAQGGLPLGRGLVLGKVLPHAPRMDLLAQLGNLAHPALAGLAPLASGLHLRLAGVELAGKLPAPALRPFLHDAPQEVTGPKGAPRLGFFVGCLANYLRPELARHALDLLSRVATVVIPPQGCCGLPAQGAGLAEAARSMAQGVLDAFLPARVDAIVTACGSCAWSLAKGLPEQIDTPQAHDLAGRVREISQVLAEHPGRFRSSLGPDQRVAVHDPCHLKVGLKAHQEPRDLLQAAGVELAPLAQADACCGGGGLFALNQPEMSQAIFSARAADLAASGAGVLATSCSGCWLQWRANLDARTPVVHPIELIAACD